MRFLQKLVDRCDRRVEHNRERELREEALPKQDEEHVQAMEGQIRALGDDVTVREARLAQLDELIAQEVAQQQQEAIPIGDTSALSLSSSDQGAAAASVNAPPLPTPQGLQAQLAQYQAERLAVEREVHAITAQMDDLMEQCQAIVDKHSKKKRLIVCPISGNLLSSTDTEDRLQAHYEGKVYKGWKRVRDVLKILRAKNPPPSRGGKREASDRAKASGEGVPSRHKLRLRSSEPSRGATAASGREASGSAMMSRRSLGSPSRADWRVERRARDVDMGRDADDYSGGGRGSGSRSRTAMRTGYYDGGGASSSSRQEGRRGRNSSSSAGRQRSGMDSSAGRRRRDSRSRSSRGSMSRSRMRSSRATAHSRTRSRSRGRRRGRTTSRSRSSSSSRGSRSSSGAGGGSVSSRKSSRSSNASTSSRLRRRRPRRGRVGGRESRSRSSSSSSSHSSRSRRGRGGGDGGGDTSSRSVHRRQQERRRRRYSRST
jgi:hypothetical protein